MQRYVFLNECGSTHMNIQILCVLFFHFYLIYNYVCIYIYRDIYLFRYIYKKIQGSNFQADLKQYGFPVCSAVWRKSTSWHYQNWQSLTCGRKYNLCTVLWFCSSLFPGVLKVIFTIFIPRWNEWKKNTKEDTIIMISSGIFKNCVIAHNDINL